MTPQSDQVRQPPGHRARQYQRMLAGGAVGTCALLVAACGSTAAPSTSSASSSGAGSGAASGSTGSTPAGTASAAKVTLQVTFAASASAPATSYTLRCEPAGGTVHNPAAACARLLTGASLFAPKPAHMLCPMIMESAARATVTGTYLGKRVRETIFEGGCDLARWAKLKRVFG